MRRLFPFFLIFILIWGCLAGNDNAPNYRNALNQLIENAGKGDSKAMFDLARLYETGFDSIPQDSVVSLNLYLHSAHKGYAPAMNYVGFRYYLGKGLRQDLDSALFWIKKAAELGDVTAASNLGYMLTETHEIPYDEEEAVKWLTIASDGGVTEAQIRLIDIMGDKWDNLSADSALLIGINHYLDKSPIVGTHLIEISAIKGNPKALALLGDAYSKGVGVPYDNKKSIDYFYKAALAGDPSAMFIIAELLEFFPDELKDEADKEYKNPRYWYEKAAINGISDSESAYEWLYSVPGD